jgi:hypothetical protein
METLSLGKTQLPASRFPEPAGVYVCDKCGEDITAYLHRGQPHAWRPLGPSRYKCRCGQEYLSGAIEWDNLSNWEKRSRLRQDLGILILIAVPLTAFVFLLRTAVAHRGIALSVLCVAAALPGILLLLAFAAFVLEGFEVVLSLWRTRVGPQTGRS